MTATSGRSIAALLNNSGPLGYLLRMCLESSPPCSTRCYLTWKVKVTKSGRSIYQLAPSMPRIGESGFGLWPTPMTVNTTSQKAKAGRPTAGPSRGGASWGLEDMVRMWPTPAATDAEPITGGQQYVTRTGTIRAKYGKTSSNRGLGATVQMWRTPRANDWKGGVTGKNGSQRSESDYFLPDQVNAAEGLILPTPTANRWDGLQSHGKNVISGQLNPTWVEWLQGFPMNWTEV
jgi:DNA (cytosine-5)-methyltransferase 1